MLVSISMSEAVKKKEEAFHRKSVHKSVFQKRSQSSSNYMFGNSTTLKALPLLKRMSCKVVFNKIVFILCLVV